MVKIYIGMKSYVSYPTLILNPQMHFSFLDRMFCLLFFFLKKVFGGHTCPFFGACFGFLVMSPLGFKARLGSALFAFCRGECNVHSPRSTSGATLADL